MNPLLGQDQFSLAGDAQVIGLIPMQDLDLILALHQGIARDLPLG
jgi:hypothetical protein